MNPLSISFVAKSNGELPSDKQMDSFLIPAVGHSNPPWKADKIAKDDLGEFIMK